jgi:hypothetical protein
VFVQCLACYDFSVRRLSTNTNPKLYQFDRDYGFWGTPGFSQEIYYKEYGKSILVRHDDLGNRNTYSSRTADNKKSEKILFLGGSHTWGAGVGNSETYPALIESRSGLSCLNYGHCSFGVDQMVLVLLKKLTNLSVKTVVMELHPWVVHRILRKSAIGYPKPYFSFEGDELRLHQVPTISKVPLVRRYLSEYAEFEKNLREFQAGLDLNATATKRSNDPLFNVWDQGYYANMYCLISKLLLIARDVCEQNGSRLMIVLGPTVQELLHEPLAYDYVNPSIPRRRLKALMDNANIHYLDLEPKFELLGGDKDPGLFSDGHINNRGHQIFAEEISRELS